MTRPADAAQPPRVGDVVRPPRRDDEYLLEAMGGIRRRFGQQAREIRRRKGRR